ncbi:hypothetical protein SLS55_003472 [Diplodia seriata]|uniref:F-box domain-containing protein n=1 Tax=Diplodia seriata TaxID=420778 RepID=A0ABR3CN41_9PEZI
MGFDIFCAVCGGPACAHITIDDKSRKAAVREKREVDPSFSEKDLNRREFCGYDPEVVSPEDVQWTYKAQVLGFNPQATGIDNYRVYDATQTACYPIHEPCLKLLTRVLCGNDNIDNLDKDTLYHIISGLMGWDLPKLDYGEPSVEHDQWWWSKPGEETANAKMMVIYPLSNPTFTTLLRNTVSTDDFALPTPPGTTDPATSASLSARVRRDPFARLPYDITHQILLLLPAEAVPRLATASYPVHAAVRSSARNPGFWRQALRRCMPWFWELHVLMRHGTVDPEETDFKGLFLWLEACTRPRRGLEGPFMGVANRRRVWGVCEQYDALYVRRVREKERESAVGREAREIWRGVVNTGLPVVVWPVPVPENEGGLRTSTTQWVCAWEEVQGGAVLEVTWDEQHTLMGLTLVVSGERRLFGSDGGGRFGSRLKKETVEIEPGCWIRGLVLHIPDVFHKEKAETSIKGITIRMTNGKDVKLGDTNPTHCQRLLPISSDHVLVGIMGQVTKADEDNRMRITRLGLLQHPRPDSAILSPSSPSETTPPQLPLLHQPLWTSPPTAAAAAAAATPLHNPSHPIWSNNSTLRALPSTDRPLLRYQIQNPWHEDIVPTHPLIFAANEFERRNLARLTAWLCDDGRHVCCVRAEYRAESKLAPREIGPAAVRRMLMREGGNEAPMWWREWAAGLKEVRTNEGQVYWGESPIKDTWVFENREADEGEKIVGIALAFTFGNRKEDIAHRWDDGSDMVLMERLQLSWLATLVAKE